MKQFLIERAEYDCDIYGQLLNSYYYSTDTLTSIVLNFNCTGGTAGTKSAFRDACAAQNYESGTCLLSPPEICGDDWDPDGIKQMTIRNGCYVASKCDPDAVASDLGCNSEIRLCKDGVPWMFRPTADGGWIQYDPDGVETGGKYNASGTRTATIPPGEESMY